MKTRRRKHLDAKLKLRLERKQPRITKESYTFVKIIQEFSARGLNVDQTYELEWNQQRDQIPVHRKVRLVGGRVVTTHAIISGKTPLNKDVAERRRKEKLARSSHRTREHWKESAAWISAVAILDPDNKIGWEMLLNGRAADVIVWPKAFLGHGRFGIQIKSRESSDLAVSLSIKRIDGEEGGKYQGIALLGIIVDKYHDPNSALSQFDRVPTLEVKELFLYKSASCMTHKHLHPYPRRNKHDLYGDSRFVFGFDDRERLQKMQRSFFEMILEGVSKESCPTRYNYWFSFGKGSPNPIFSEKLVRELHGIEYLANYFGFDNIRAPIRQQEVVDLVLNVGKKEIKISLKTASSVTNSSYRFRIRHKNCDSPHWEHCDRVLALYKDGKVSVFDPVKVYSNTKKTIFYWSMGNSNVKRYNLHELQL